MNLSDIKLECGSKSYSTEPNAIMFYRYKHVLMNESSDINLSELKSYSIRPTSPNDKTIILLCYTNVNINMRLNE